MAKQAKTYPGGAHGVIARYESRRDPLVFSRVELPPADADLAALRDHVVPAGYAAPPPPRSGSFLVKSARIAREFIGNSELAFLNALLIANLRKRSQPPQCAPLFQRLWAEESDHLIDALDLRWKVSSVTTFADCGATPVQRELGRALQVLFGMMKLYEFERTFSRQSPADPWPAPKRRKWPLPLDMGPYSLGAGGLDVNILGPLWEMARTEPVMGPLACHLLDALNADHRTLFRRLALMRQRAADIAESEAGTEAPDATGDTDETDDTDDTDQTHDSTDTPLGDRRDDPGPGRADP